MTRSLQSMFIQASRLGNTFVAVCEEGQLVYKGKNPRDVFQAVRELEVATVAMLNDAGVTVDFAFLTPGEEEYICDCWVNGFFDNWAI